MLCRAEPFSTFCWGLDSKSYASFAKGMGARSPTAPEWLGERSLAICHRLRETSPVLHQKRALALSRCGSFTRARYCLRKADLSRATLECTSFFFYP